jgi:hypothetical protein
MTKKDEALEVITEGLPVAWANLIKGIALLSEHRIDNNYPFDCKHDILVVMSDDSKFTEEQRDYLEKLGFNVNDNDGGFYSMKYGSA